MNLLKNILKISIQNFDSIVFFFKSIKLVV